MAKHRIKNMGRTIFCTLLTGSALFVLGCGSPEEVPFDDTLLASINPLLGTINFPPVDNNNTYPEVYLDDNGTKSDDMGQSWAQVKGYVKAPISKVWKALQDKQVVTDRAEIQSRFLGECALGVRGKSDICLVFNNVPPGGLGSLFDYQITWRHQVLAGTPENPTKIRIEYQKTKGTGFISVLHGAVVIEKMFDTATGNDLNVTSYAHFGELKEPERPYERIRLFVPLMYRSVVAYVHNQPLP